MIDSTAGLPIYKERFIRDLNNIRNKSNEGTEYWFARDIQERLGYARWENFVEVIGKAQKACESTGVDTQNHFLNLTKKVRVGSGAMADKEDYILSRYACYLVAMNGDPRKREIGFAQSYFAVQARRQELADKGLEKRLELRNRVKSAVKNLNSAAKEAGVQNYGLFHDAGLKDIKMRKAIADKDGLFDRASRAELAANEFRITQAEEKLRRERVTGERPATDAHFTVGQEVRTAIRRIGGTMPEDLPAEESIDQLEHKNKRVETLKGPNDANEP